MDCNTGRYDIMRMTYVNYSADLDVTKLADKEMVYDRESGKAYIRDGVLLVPIGGGGLTTEFRTVLELQASTVPLDEGTVVRVNGYYEEGDGGSHERIIVDNIDDFSVPIANQKHATLVEPGMINVRFLGATGDGTTDDTVALQKGVTGGADLYFPNGVYCVTGLSGQKNHTAFKGDDKWGSTIKLTTIGTLYNTESLGKYLNIADMGFISSAPVGTAFEAGTTCFNMFANLTMQNVAIGGFETLIEWQGGYYHKYTNCDFRNTNIIGKTFNANNLTISDSWLHEFNTGFYFNGGTGDVVLSCCAIEGFSGIVMSQEAGSTSSVTVENCYVETSSNGATRDIGLDPYVARGVLVSLGKSDCHFTNNNIQTRGIYRIVDLRGTDNEYPNTLNASGNKFIMSGDEFNDVEFIYRFSSNAKNIIVNDVVQYWDLGHSGNYPMNYVNSQFSKVLSGYNPITGESYSRTSTWTYPELMNGWVNNEDNPIKYKVQGKVLYINGVVSGADATSNSIFEFDTNIVDVSQICDEPYLYFPVSDSNTTVASHARLGTVSNSILSEDRGYHTIINCSIPL